MKYLVTGMVEFYQWVEANSEDEALFEVDMEAWRQTMNQPIQNIEAKLMEVETTGVESEIPTLRSEED